MTIKLKQSGFEHAKKLIRTRRCVLDGRDGEMPSAELGPAVFLDEAVFGRARGTMIAPVQEPLQVSPRRG
jgi:hypothetical protein